MSLYLDLLEGCLAGTIYRDPPMDPQYGILRSADGRVLDFQEARGAPGVYTLEPGTYNPAAREFGRDWPLSAHTSIGLRRLRTIREIVYLILRNNIPGDFIDCGVWRGGSAIMMLGCLQELAGSFPGGYRRVWLGVLPDATHGLMNRGAPAVEEVLANVEAYGLTSDRVRPLVGPDELLGTDGKSGPSGPFVLVRVDQSAPPDTLPALYDRIVPTGYIILDDRDPSLTARAIAFRATNKITSPLMNSEAGIFWRK